MVLRIVQILVLALVLIGCNDRRGTFTPQTTRSVSAKSSIVAILGNKTIRKDDLWSALIELAGHEVMNDAILTVAIEEALHQIGMGVSKEEIAYEESLFTSLVPETSEEMLEAMFSSKGIGSHRFKQLLWRNAALRKLIAEQVNVTDASVQRMFSIVHGGSYPARIIVVTTLDEANIIHAKLLDGELFSDMAVQYSIDSSAIRGGLVDPISIADSSWPSPIREFLPTLAIHEISPPILISDRWVILTVTDQPNTTDSQIEDVFPEMKRLAILAQERLLMEQLASSLQTKYKPSIFDSDMKRVLGSDTYNSQ